MLFDLTLSYCFNSSSPRGNDDLKQNERVKSNNIKIRMNEAKNRQMATHIVPNARIKDLKKMNMTELRKKQFPG